MPSKTRWIRACPTSTGLQPDVGAETGIRPPAEMPAYVQNTLQYSQNEMDDDSGLLDLSGLARKKVTPAGDTLQGLKESQQTIMRLRGRYIEIAIRDLGEQMTPNIDQFYTMQRRMWMFGRSGVTYQDVWDANMATMVPPAVLDRIMLRISVSKSRAGRYST